MAQQIIWELGDPKLGSGQLYDRVMPILRQRVRDAGYKAEGIRKQDFLPFAADVQRRVKLEKPIELEDSLRMVTEREEMRKHYRSPEVLDRLPPTSPVAQKKYAYFVDIKYKKRVWTKGGMQVRYMSVWLGDFTPKQFSIYRRQRTRGGTYVMNKKIAEVLQAANETGEYVPFEILGFWTTEARGPQ